MNQTIELGFNKIELKSNESGQWFRFFRRGAPYSKPINIMATIIEEVSSESIVFKQGVFTYSFQFTKDNNHINSVQFMVKLFHVIPYWRIKGIINNSDKEIIINAFQ